MARTVVVTGTATGIGRATVERFAREGWNVVATVRKERDLDVHRDLTSVRTVLLDVDDERADHAFADLAFEQFGAVDALVNNAGTYQLGPLESSTMDEVHALFQTNLFGLIALTQAFLPRFRQQRSGVIVNVSSTSADLPYQFNTLYSASKSAVAVLSEALNLELDGFGVTVKAVLPGRHDTAIFSKLTLPDDLPEDYRAAFEALSASADGPAGSAPEVSADVIFAAVVDDDVRRVRYYAGPDAKLVVRAREELNPTEFWDEFRAASLGEPSQRWQSLSA